MPVISHNRLRGMATLSLEHESNGKDSIDNRSWNYLTLSGVYFHNAAFPFRLKYGTGGCPTEIGTCLIIGDMD